MYKIEYVCLQDIDPGEMLDIVNEQSIRTHLVDHPRFDLDSIQEWMSGKIETDNLPGCQVRAIRIDGALAGWCGIQPDDKGVELAIVISQQFWGTGLDVFKTLMRWASELGHRAVLFHLLESRPEYKALHKRASKVYKSTMMGRRFTTYLIPVQ